ncbi:MAG: GIY-YIG nuclease family protein [Anaerolineaceae bacterium]|nr:GIY-YIG nuclease family protein [Anaerolineaceae bacterium]
MIGKLGCFYFPEGSYYYVGSAKGLGGVKARIKRHLRKTKKKHWHIDYLLAEAEVNDIYLHRGDQLSECDLIDLLLTRQGNEFPAPGFGASDCRGGCEAHLVFSKELGAIDLFIDLRIPVESLSHSLEK